MVAFVTAGSLLFVSVYRVLFLLVSIFGYSVYFIDEDKVDKKGKGWEWGGRQEEHSRSTSRSKLLYI